MAIEHVWPHGAKDWEMAVSFGRQISGLAALPKPQITSNKK